MLDKIKIKNFKSLKKATIKLKNLNLFVGTNSSGKSSAIQSLLVMHQNLIREDNCGFNGPYISLGSFNEIRNYSSRKSGKVSIEAEENGQKYKLEFSPLDEDGKKEYAIISDSLCEKYNKTLKYLSCHRVGAKNLYSKNYDGDDNIGNEGEYAISYLSDMGDQPIESELIAPSTNQNSYVTNDLKTQTNYWLNKIVSTEIKIKKIEKTDSVRAEYLSAVSREGMKKHTRPIHVGSGVSYLISIIIVCLSSRKGDIIIIENPEIHLHPKAQAQLCDFLYFISKSGRQLIVETHSDHIFDGVRAGTAIGEMETDNISINFFRRKNNSSNTEVIPIVIGAKGRVSSFNPNEELQDLFDQFDINLDKMLGM